MMYFLLGHSSKCTGGIHVLQRNTGEHERHIFTVGEYEGHT
jgi:hypothetical protein